MVAQLIKIFPRMSWNLRFTAELMRILFKALSKHTSQNPSWYSSLKSISILSPHIHKGLLNGLLPSPFSIRKSVLDNSTPCMLHSLPILPLFFDTPVYDEWHKLWNSTLCILSSHLLLSLLQTLFSSLCSQTEPAYKWQKTLTSLKSSFLCYSFHNFPYNPYFTQQNGLIK